ncbi:MAG TPA: LysR family transcriptional regulator [Candidatus Pygmaiobacter gallistercoris]|nr:LysR family transcriptional regulator [Candidatus Pygmaiobacter gallistercoris]
MEFRRLEYFLAVAREESITRAAEALNMTQPPLSREMKALEEELGRQLLVRGSRKVTLTEEGRILRRRAEEMLELMEKTRAEVQASGDQVAGDLQIGGGETCGMALVAEAICRLQQRYPLIRVHLYSGNAPDVFERLDNGLIDFGLVIDPVDLDKYDHLQLPYRDTWGLLLRRDHPLAEKEAIEVEDLEDLPLLVSRQAFVRDGIAGWLGSRRRSPRILGTYNLIFNASLLVLQGAGCALCLSHLVPEYEGSLLTFRPFRPLLQSGVSVAWKKYQDFPKPAAHFLEMLQQVLGEHSHPTKTE